ncbi:hypothetical protein Acr_07g0014670 [Actinidia rufa]|uniref:Uncharacterized protein n=1 Tax=Actinidia rufa TaxID=165716 RepID=A0A7J0EXR7_9ERIC|nr:hypothetical protein Acr_07g0014670 [Actinidia rufa]
MSNGNLYDRLHLPEGDPNIIKWPLRVKIAVGLARGLAWLHCNSKLRVFHHSINSKCVLLDQNWVPKISNFGDAKFMSSNETSSFRSFSINGELLELGLDKNDVYSFGVVLLELVTGKEPTSTSVDWIIDLSSGSFRLEDVVDNSLIGLGFDSEIFQFLSIARKCVESFPDQGPTMPEVYQTMRVIGEKHGLVDDFEMSKQTDQIASASKLALNQIVASWKVCPSIQFHGSGWIIFQFSSRDDQEKILENGPYMIYGSPLLLKQMDKYFRFGKEAISTFPVWVQLRGVPLTFWNPVIFGKICSKLGKPIHMDKLTTQKERTTYARCLVEIDMAKDLVHSVQLHMPEGDEHEQKIFYENLPKYCSHCRMVGHTKETCKSKSLPSKKTVVQVAESTVQVPKEDAVQLTGMGGNSGAIVVQLAETTMQRPKEATVQLSGVGGKSGALSTKEWVMKMAIHPIDNTISQPQSNNPETEANNNIVPSKNLAGTSESPVTEEDIATPTDPYQTPKQIGGEIYIQQANQITSGELKSKLHQLSKSQGSTAHGNLKKGHVSVPRRQGNAALAKPPDKASSSSIIPPLLEKDGERRKKKDKVNQGKGLNMPLKQGEVRNHLRRKKVAIMGIMETKLNHHTLEGIARTKFVGWRVANNFSHHPNGRILILWKEELVRLDIIETTDQNSWILLGDFNNVLNNDERINGQPVTMYETREFKDCCYDLGLSDLRSSGMFHTWSNNKIWCKLDRAMVNTAWTQKGLSGQAHFDTPGIHSDHSPCTISVMGENDRGPNPFKFFNMWTRHEDFQNIVSNTWGMHVVGSAMFRLCKKLKSLKEPLKSLNKHHFSHISERVKAAEVELAHAQQQLHDNTIDTLLQSRVLELRSRALKLAEAEASYCSQLAKAKYLKNCDRGSKFFHDLIKSRQTKSIISSITLGNGSRSNSSKQISDAFVQFYESLLGTKEDCSGLNSEIVSSGRRLNPSQADNLICPVTEEEIKKALFSIGQDKAPGPDGFTSCFFKKAWTTVGEDFIAAVKEFFSSGQILRQINHSVLALIPKFKDADKVEDFRPIACCNVIYKVISKIIALRLAPALISVIDPAQAAYVQNRKMVENIFLLQELLRQYGRKRSSPRCILKVDIRKSLRFSGLELYSRHASGPEFPINLYRGLRQGDPLSPYLFVLCLEYLSRSMGDLKNNPDFNFHPRCGGLKITHLAYADDLILLSRGDPTSVSLIMERLIWFGECSGLKISLSKSSFFSAGINPTDTEIIERTTGFNQGIFPFKYLGIPVAASRLSIAQFSPFIDKISGYISAWAGASLSYAGRTELIKSVLQGVECFWLSILPIPVGVRNKITQLCRNFLWSGKCTVNKRPLVAWKEITLPKQEGGLGIRNSKAWNKALLSKTLWDIQAKKDSLWVQWVHQIYLNRRSFWEYKNRHEDSPLLKQVVTLRDELIEAEGSLENAVQRLNQWAPNGEFQSKLAYEFFRPKGATVTWPKLVWHNSITPKHSFILWLGLKDRLLTRDKLRDFIEDQSCPLCSFEAESIDHLFFYCQVGNQIWTEIKSWLGISRAMTTLKSAVKWMIKEARGTGLPAKIKKISLACTIYHIWVARNKRIFEGKTDHTKAIIRRIQIHVYRSIYILFPDFRPEIL